MNYQESSCHCNLNSKSNSLAGWMTKSQNSIVCKTELNKQLFLMCSIYVKDKRIPQAYLKGNVHI